MKESDFDKAPFFAFFFNCGMFDLLSYKNYHNFLLFVGVSSIVHELTRKSENWL